MPPWGLARGRANIGADPWHPEFRALFLHDHFVNSRLALLSLLAMACSALLGMAGLNAETMSPESSGEGVPK